MIKYNHVIYYVKVHHIVTVFTKPNHVLSDILNAKAHIMLRHILERNINI